MEDNRIDRKMSVKEFANFFGISKKKMNKWLNGDHNFNIEEIALICEKLDIDIDTYFDQILDRKGLKKE